MLFQTAPFRFRIIFTCWCLISIRISFGQRNKVFHHNPLEEHLNYGQPMSLPIMQEKEQMKRAFIDLLNMLDVLVLPEHICQQKNNLINFVVSDQIDVFLVMKYTQKYKNISKFDNMVAALLILKDTLPSFCPLGYDIGHLILYAIFNKFLLDKNILHIEEVCKKFYEFPQHPGSCNNCETYIYLESLKKTLCARDQDIPRMSEHSTVILEPVVALNTTVQVVSETTLQNEEVVTLIDTDRLLSLIPEPTTEEDTKNFDSLKAYLNTTEMKQYLDHVDRSQYKDDQEVLNIILEHVIETNVSISIKQTAFYYLKSKEAESKKKTLFDFSVLVKFLPQPINEEEDQLYAIAKSFLSGTAIYYYIPSIHDDDYSNLKLLYKAVLYSLKDNPELNTGISIAFQYYYNYEEEFDDVELHATRVQEQKFNLRKVFNSIFTNLTPQDNINLKLLLRFVSKYPSSMNNFQIPSEVQTYGHLGFAIMQFLSNSPNIPERLKEAIPELIPLINYSGNGADLI